MTTAVNKNAARTDASHLKTMVNSIFGVRVITYF
jgi:hypothetical protein